MDFQSKSFPYQLYSKNKKRELFSSYGSHDNIDVSNVAEKEFFPQKIPEGFVNRDGRFKAKRPALPLYDCPEPAKYPVEDKITGPVIEERKELSNLVTNLKYAKGVMGSGRQGKIHICNSFKHLRKRIVNSENLTRLPKKFEALAMMYDKYKSVREIKKVNSKYTDGCLAFISSSGSNGCLISPSNDFKDLKISAVSLELEEDIKVIGTTSVNCNDEIYGVSSCYIRDKGFIMTRHSSSCQMYCLKDNNVPEMIDNFVTENIRPTSQCISPYIPGESLVATADGSVFLWTVDSGKERIIEERGHRFHCDDEWRQAIYGSHPRRVVISDCTAVEIIDMRKKSSTGNGTDLFCLPNKFLHPNERIRITKQFSPFQYVVATDYNLIVTDERFPGLPLLQWQHLLQSPPQYLSTTDIGTDKQSLLGIASQYPMEALCYIVQGGVGETLQGYGAPWKIARPDDFMKWNDICSGPDATAVCQRYDRDSLTGLQCVQYQQGFISYQLDSYGDIFYQVYQTANHNEDKTFSAGPGMDDIKLDDVTIRKGKNWVHAVNEAWNNPKDKTDLPVTDVTDQIDETILAKPSHVECSICSKSAVSDDTTCSKYQSTGDNSEEAVCHCCGLNIATGKFISESVSSDKVCSILSTDLKSLPSVKSLPCDILSEMILRLWRESDISDLLPKRDEEVKKKLQKRKESKKKMSSSKKGMDVLDFPPELLAEIDKESSEGLSEKGMVQNDSDKEESLYQSDRDMSIEGTDTLVDSITSKDITEIQKSDIEKNIDSRQDCTDNNKSSVVESSSQEFNEPHHITPRRKRHPSTSSFLSDLSVSSDSLPGFMRTPQRKTKSSKIKTVSDLSDNEFVDEQFLSQESRDSVQSLNQKLNTCDSPRKRFKHGPQYGQKMLSPPSSSKKKVKIRKTFVSGF